MKKIFLLSILTLSLTAIASEKLKLGLYLPTDNKSCAYQVVDQHNDNIVIIFRKNPIVVLHDPCAYGVDYPIAVEVLNSRTFIDLRTDREFKYFSKY